MVTDDKMVDLLLRLSGEFNVLVKNIGVDHTKQQNECTVVTLDEKTDPSIIPTLPQTVGQETVQYELAGQQIAAPAIPCGQTGHQCVCGTGLPKPE